MKLIFLLLCLAAGPGLAEPVPEPVANYEVRGVLQSVNLTRHSAVITHEKIGDYMPAMIMSFDVRGPAIPPSLRPGDPVLFELCVGTRAAWIEHIRGTGGLPEPVFEPAAAARVPALGIGDRVPDLEVVDAQGRAWRLQDFRGQALAITFVYARCPLPNYCPLLNRNFQVAQALLTRLGAGENWHFFSISLDAAHDTPEILTASAESYGALAEHWTFVTAPEAKVRVFGGAMGLEFTQAAGQISHNLRTVVVDASGRIQQIHAGNTWTPQELAAEIQAGMASAGAP